MAVSRAREIEAWNAFMTKRGWRDVGTQRLNERLAEIGLPLARCRRDAWNTSIWMKGGVSLTGGEAERQPKWLHTSFTKARRLCMPVILPLGWWKLHEEVILFYLFKAIVARGLCKQDIQSSGTSPRSKLIDAALGVKAPWCDPPGNR